MGQPENQNSRNDQQNSQCDQKRKLSPALIPGLEFTALSLLELSSSILRTQRLSSPQ